MRVLVAVVSASLFLMPAPTQAYSFMSGNDLHEYCAASPERSEEEAIRAMFCVGYIRGAFEQLWGDEVDKGNRPDECLPQGVTNQQIIDIIKVYVRDHPAERHTSAMIIVESALLNAFPDCFSGPI